MKNHPIRRIMQAAFLLVCFLFSSTLAQEPLKLQEMPEAYVQPSEQQGRVVRIDYETCTYDEENRRMNKYAYVYVPYGYDENNRYPIFYLMHGGSGDAELYLGGENGNRPLKRILDRLIENGDMEPMLVVTPSYYQDNQQKGYTISREDATLTANFYHELVNDLMPAVESVYHTYAETVDAAGFQASRAHRIFGGFSMGSVTTWYTFIQALDDFRYFMPISGDCWAVSRTGRNTTLEGANETAKALSDAVQNSNYAPDDFYIYALTGTEDMAYTPLSRQIEAMKAYPESFEYSDNAEEGNLHFQVMEGGIHDYSSMTVYIYNALPVFSAQMTHN